MHSAQCAYQITPIRRRNDVAIIITDIFSSFFTFFLLMFLLLCCLHYIFVVFFFLLRYLIRWEWVLSIHRNYHYGILLCLESVHADFPLDFRSHFHRNRTAFFLLFSISIKIMMWNLGIWYTNRTECRVPSVECIGKQQSLFPLFYIIWSLNRVISWTIGVFNCYPIPHIWKVHFLTPNTEHIGKHICRLPSLLFAIADCLFLLWLLDCFYLLLLLFTNLRSNHRPPTMWAQKFQLVVMWIVDSEQHQLLQSKKRGIFSVINALFIALFNNLTNSKNAFHVVLELWAHDITTQLNGQTVFIFSNMKYFFSNHILIVEIGLGIGSWAFIFIICKLLSIIFFFK